MNRLAAMVDGYVVEGDCFSFIDVVGMIRKGSENGFAN